MPLVQSKCTVRTNCFIIWKYGKIIRHIQVQYSEILVVFWGGGLKLIDFWAALSNITPREKINFPPFLSVASGSGAQLDVWTALKWKENNRFSVKHHSSSQELHCQVDFLGHGPVIWRMGKKDRKKGLRFYARNIRAHVTDTWAGWRPLRQPFQQLL